MSAVKKQMEFHRYADAWRLLKGQEFDELVADIKENGLREKIWLYEGKILDGRNRYAACKKAGVEPKYRTYQGSSPISFVISLNKHRRHDSEADRAFAAAKIADMRQGERTDLAPRDAKSQTDTATEMGVSRRSVQRAKQVISKGSKALQEAAQSGEIPLQRAASVVNLPKSEQVKAATAPKAPKPKTRKSKPAKAPPEPNPVLDDKWAPDADEIASAELAEKEYLSSIDKVMEADDKLAAAHKEIKRQAEEIAVLRLARDGFMNGKAAITKLLKTEQSKVDKLRKQLEKAANDNERLSERIAIMDTA